MIKRIVQFLISLAVASFFCYLIYDQVAANKDEILAIMKQGLGLWPYFFLVAASYLLALLVRAHRWVMMMNSRKDFWLASRSIALGYLVQLPASKLGEVVRILNQRNFSDVPIGKILATVFVDRMLDFLAFLVLLIFALYYGGEAMENDFQEFSALLPKFVIIIGGGVAAVIFLILFGEKVATKIYSIEWLPKIIAEKGAGFLSKFSSGLEFIKTPSQFAYLFVSTILIWMGYFFMLYFAMAFFPQIPDSFAMLDFLFIFTCSAIGMLVPAPAGMGSYQYFTSQGVNIVFEMGQAEIMGIVIFSYILSIWVANTVFGLISFVTQLILARKRNKIKEE